MSAKWFFTSGTAAMFFMGHVICANGNVSDKPLFERRDEAEILWLESANVHSPWEGSDLSRVMDLESGYPCLEWSQDPALQGEATLALPGVKLENYDAVRLQWKYIGGGSQLMVQTGGRNWYLNKERHAPDQWHDVWLDLNLDDDRIGAVTNSQGELVFKLIFRNAALKRPDEQEWRRIRVRDVRLVKMPLKLSCDPRKVSCEWQDGAAVTRFPLVISNATQRTQNVSLLLDPAECRHFSYSFSESKFRLRPRSAASLTLTFTAPEETALTLPPLYFEQVPVYAMIDGKPLSLTTWYRGYFIWKTGGVVPPRDLKRPYMTAEKMRTLVTSAQSNAIIASAEAILKEPVSVHDIRHGYPTKYECPVHGRGYPVELDLQEFRKHRCTKGDHELVGYEKLDKEAGIRKHTINSQNCETLGKAYWLTGDQRFARRAADWLLAYAAKLPGWDYLRTENRATAFCCRVGSSMLGESWWIHGFNSGYDFVADAPCITPAERELIERDFFAIEAEEIQGHRVSANQQCEVMTSAGSAAINAGNWYLAARTITGDYGLLDQVEMTFSSDGFSLENDLAYHFAALIPITRFGEVYEALGGTFFTERVKRIFDAPIAYQPNGIPPHTDLYRRAALHFDDDNYIFDDAADRPLRNSSLSMAGRTTLRRGTAGDYKAVQIMWGGPTWRGGRDLLNYITPLNTSITRINYGINLPNPGLSYCTFAGNVPVVDNLEQTGNRARQTAILEGEFPAAKFDAPRATPFYAGVDLTRVVAIIDNAYVVIDRLRSDRPRRYSFTFHAPDEVLATPNLEFAAYPEFRNEGPPAVYHAVTNPAIARGVSKWLVEYALKERGKIVKKGRWQGSTGGEGELIRGEAWNGWWAELKPMFIARREAPSITTVQIIDEVTEEPSASFEIVPLRVDGQPVESTAGTALKVTTANGSFLLVECDLPGTKEALGRTGSESLWIERVQ